MMSTMLVFALGLWWFTGASVSLVSAAGPPKAEVCHAQGDYWKLLRIGGPALDNHLSHHDDAVPGGVTADSATVLDDECNPVPAPCPCEGLANPPVVWDATFTVAGCTETLPTGVLQLASAPPTAAAALELHRVERQCLVVLDPLLPPVGVSGLTRNQVAGCSLSLRLLAAQDGVLCESVE